MLLERTPCDLQGNGGAQAAGDRPRGSQPLQPRPQRTALHILQHRCWAALHIAPAPFEQLQSNDYGEDLEKGPCITNITWDAIDVFEGSIIVYDTKWVNVNVIPTPSFSADMRHEGL